MDSFVASVEGTLKCHQLAATPHNIFSTALNLAPLLLGQQSAQSEARVGEQVQLLLASLEHLSAVVQQGDQQLSLPLLCCCAAVLLVVRNNFPSAKDDQGMAKAEAATVGVLLRILKRSPPIPAEVEGATLCLARMYPACGDAAVDACAKALASVEGFDGIGVEEAVGVLGNVAEHLASSDEEFIEQKLFLIERAFTSVQLQHREPTTIPLVIRKTLIPLLLSVPTKIPEYRPKAVALIHHFAANMQTVPEAVVLTAALFDLFFPALPATPGPNKLSADQARTWINQEDDLRYDEKIWEMVRDSLRRVSKSSEDPSKKSSLHQQVIYLLKRIVEYTNQQYLPVFGGGSTGGGGKKGKEGKKGAKAGSTTPAPTAPAAPIRFSNDFVWAGHQTEQQWETFFLIFETLNEYGAHLITPMMPKLLNLCEVVAKDQGASYPLLWVETLFHKALAHGNVGVRRVALNVMWGLDNETLLRRIPFTNEFLFETVLASSTDPKLCTEVDRASLPGTFLDCKVFGGKEDQTLPTVLPVILKAERFFLTVFENIVIANSGDTVLLSNALREQFTRCFMTLRGTNTRFGITALLRILAACAKAMSMPLMNSELCALLVECAREVIHDRHSNWLEARMLALLLDSGFHLTQDDAAVYQSSIFHEFLAVVGKGGTSGGKTLTALDGSGVAGVSGTCLSRGGFYKRLAQYSQQFPSFAEYVNTKVWRECCKAMTQQDIVSQFSSGDAKRLTVLLPLTDLSSSSTKEALQCIEADLETLSSRTNVALDVLVGKWLLFAECGELLPETVGSTAGATHAWWSESVLRQLWEHLTTSAVIGLDGALRTLQAGAKDLQEVSDLQHERWAVHVLTRWDALCAAVTRCVQHLAQHHSQNLLFIAQELKIAQFLTTIVDKYVVPLSTMNRTPPPSIAFEYGRIASIRNALRLVQAIATLHATNTLPLSVIFSGPVAESSTVSPTDLLDRLVALPALYLKVASNPSCLSTEGWGVVLAQAYRAQWNTVFCLLSCVPPEEFAKGADSQLLKTLVDRGEDELNCCSSNNLCCVVDVLSWILPYLPLEQADQITAIVHRQSGDAPKREQMRVMASYMVSMVQRQCASEESTGTGSALPEAAVDIAMDLVTSMEETETTERVMYFLSTACAVSELQAGRLASAEEGPLTNTLLRVAVFAVSSNQEDENETCLAAAEPSLSDWDSALRRDHLPTFRMAAVARSMAIAVLLYKASVNSSFRLKLALELLEMNCSDKTITYEPCMPNSRTHRCRLHTWQILLALSNAFSPEDWNAVVDKLVQCMYINNMGSVRRYMELMMIQAMWTKPDSYPVLVDNLNNLTLKTQASGSFLAVAIHLLLEKGFDSQIGPVLMRDIFPQVLRMAGSHQHLLRLMSHVGLHELIQRLIGKMKPGEWESIVEASKTTSSQMVHGMHITPELLALYDYLDKSPEAVKVREKNYGVVVYDAHFCMTPRDIFCVQRKESEFWIQESVPAALFERIRFIETELISALGAVTPFEYMRCRTLVERAGLDKLFAPMKDLDLIPHTDTFYDMYLDYSVELEPQQQQAEQQLAAADDNVQKKVTSWWNSEVHNELHPRALGIKKRQSVIMVTSLLDNPVNVAGLCRCSEIWTVEKVIVSDKKVFSHPHFVAVARSAELWTPYEVVPPQGLVEYLRRMRGEGYTIVGVEQTSTSQQLPSYKFPERTVIVLGSEGQGMPAPIIPVMDVCVEIPQYGLIRSLNVHVSGAVALYEFTRQHLMTEGEGGQPTS